MDFYKILFLTFCVQHAEGLVASAIEPYLDSSQGMFVKTDGEYWMPVEYMQAFRWYWKIVSVPTVGSDESRFYPVRIETEEYGSVIYLKCRGGIPGSAIKVDIKSGRIFCDKFNTNKPNLDEFLFHTADFGNDSTSIVIGPVKSPNLLQMWGDRLTLSDFTRCVGGTWAACQFELEYPPRRPAMFQVLHVTPDTSQVNTSAYSLETMDKAIVINEGGETALTYTKKFVVPKTVTETTTWSRKFAWSLQVTAKVGIEDFLDISAFITVGADFTKGTTNTITNTRTLKDAIFVTVPKRFRAEIFFIASINENARIPFTAKVEQIEFDFLTSKPLKSILFVNGTWTGPLMRSTWVDVKQFPLPEEGLSEKWLKLLMMILIRLLDQEASTVNGELTTGGFIGGFVLPILQLLIRSAPSSSCFYEVSSLINT